MFLYLRHTYSTYLRWWTLGEHRTMGLGQIFWIGQYVLFAEFIKNRAAEGEDGSSALFLHDWFVYGRADSRYVDAYPYP